MAFVLVQHLDPGHPSALVQLLTKSTSMPVTEVTNLLRIEPDHVYVIAPNTSMAISQGVLKLQPRQKGRSGLRPIDSFFESLANDQHERAIAIVLSGTASDGTAGCEAVKAEGGIILAQDASAKYGSMPRSAIAAGCVDLVLSPEDIAKELARMASHPFIIRSAIGPKRPSARLEENELLVQKGENGDGFRKILLLLRGHSGVDFSSYKFSTIYRRINRRLVLHKVQTLDDYARLLRGNAKELDALFSDVLINVTSFFRNPEAFDCLKRSVFPALVAERRQEPIRMWVPGCSTGQEAYSIVIAYLEFSKGIQGAPELRVFATDIHEAILERARNGFYPKTIDQDLSPERLHRFFVEDDGGYRILKSLRAMVLFARQNVLTDPPFSRMDLISCRNLLIYLESSLQKKLLPTFHYALNPKAFLFLGASESIASLTDLFETVNKKHKIFSKKAFESAESHLHFAPRHPAEKENIRLPSPLAPAEGRQAEINAQREADRVTLSRYGPAGVLVDAQLHALQFRGEIAPYLKTPAGKASFRVLNMAREGLMLPLRAALNKARREHKAVRKEGVKIRQNGDSRIVDIEVVPLENLKELHFLIFFQPSAQGAQIAPRIIETRPLLPKKDARQRVVSLEHELTETRDYLQSIQEQYEAANEELQASNEEITSANEELQSINEELETSKEELEATNEELTTVNDEMSHRNLELRQLNSDLLNFQSSANLSILLLGRDLSIRRFTAQAAKGFNLLDSDIGRPIGSLRHNLDVRDLEEIVTGVIDTVRETEREVQDKQGHRFLLRVLPYLTLEKKVDGAVLVVTDIEALKRSAQEKELAAIVESSADAIIGMDLDGTITTWNAGAERLLEYTRKEAIGQPVSRLVPQDRKSEETEIFERVRRGANVNNYETIRQRKDGSLIELSLSISAITDGTGKIVAASMIARDITERRRAEKQLARQAQQQQQLYRLADTLNQSPGSESVILEAALDAILVCLAAPRASVLLLDPEGVMRFKAWRGISDRYRQAVEGHSPWRANTRDAQTICIENLAEATVKKELRSAVEQEGIGALAFIPLTYQQRLLGKFMVYYDSPHKFTEQDLQLAQTIANQLAFGLERKKAQDALREAKDQLADQAKALEGMVNDRTAELSETNKQLEAFVYTIAHDLRAPLRSMQGFASLLVDKESQGLTPMGRDYADRINNSAQFMDALLIDLLAFARISKRRVELTPIALEAAVQKCLTQLEHEIHEKKAEVKAPGPWPKVLAHEPTLVQVLVNLVSNALKFSRPDVAPSVRLSAEPRDDSVRIWVEDNGIGIAQEHQDQVFRLFSRLEGNAYPGTGIGLAIVKKGIEHMRGNVGLESAAGRGSRFWFELPKA
jgi:two-component system CheB/CheR fusion protein